MIYQYKEYVPVIHQGAFVHPQATVIGNVIISDGVYIGPGAVLRGDFGQIIIEEGSNVQENCTIHMFPGVTVHLHKNSHIGHGAIIHGAIIKENCLIGMQAVIMDQAIIGSESIVGALTFVKTKSEIPPRSLVVGNPAKIIKQVSDEMIQWKTKGTEIYQQLAAEAHQNIIPCEPLRHTPPGRKIQSGDFEPWQENASSGKA